MKPLLVCCICSLTILGTTSAPAVDSGDNSVLAGKRIGHVELSTVDPDLKALGKSTTSDQARGHSSETWVSKSADGQIQETDVYYTATDENHKHWKVTKVVVTSPFFHISGGVNTNSEPAAIWQEYPDLRYVDATKTRDGVEVELYSSVAKGIGFVMERSTQTEPGKSWGRCRAVVVFEPGVTINTPYLGDYEPE